MAACSLSGTGCLAPSRRRGGWGLVERSLARTDQEISYGLVDQPTFFSITSHTSFYFGLIQEKVRQDTGPVILAGPGAGDGGAGGEGGGLVLGAGVVPRHPEARGLLCCGGGQHRIPSSPCHGHVMGHGAKQMYL